MTADLREGMQLNTPLANREIPIEGAVTHYVHTSTNKIRCPVNVVVVRMLSCDVNIVVLTSCAVDAGGAQAAYGLVQRRVHAVERPDVQL